MSFCDGKFKISCADIRRTFSFESQTKFETGSFNVSMLPYKLLANKKNDFMLIFFHNNYVTIFLPSTYKRCSPGLSGFCKPSAYLCDMKLCPPRMPLVKNCSMVGSDNKSKQPSLPSSSAKNFNIMSKLNPGIPV